MDPLLEPDPPARTRHDSWIDRVRAADAEAEQCFQDAVTVASDDHEFVQSIALIAIAAELRAARIARRPGAGQ